MANELEATSGLLPVTQQAVKDLKAQRELLKKFVQSQLVEADFSDSKSARFGEGDYGIIPGTKKRVLLKSGAEKFLKLFNLGVRFKLADKEVDKINNIALYTYTAEVYTLRGSLVLAECQATANSQEVKYKERTEWRTNEKGVRTSTKVETPIYDVLNTLQKMAQKRALVGAVLLATGASEYFTQDMIEEELAHENTRDVSPKASVNDHETPVTNPTDSPICCGQKMMISKYVDKDLGHKPFYCLTCRKKTPAEMAAS